MQIHACNSIFYMQLSILARWWIIQTKTYSYLEWQIYVVFWTKIYYLSVSLQAQWAVFYQVKYISVITGLAISILPFNSCASLWSPPG